MAHASATLVKKAVHQNTVLSRQGMLERLFSLWFSGFVYNQIWEDPDVDLEALEIDGSSRMLTISSGGCNIMNYLLASPEAVFAVDLNINHMSLARLKLEGARRLPDYDAFFTFFAKADSPINVRRYHQYIREYLDETTRNHFDTWVFSGLNGPRINYFKDNIYDHAKLGWFLRFLHLATRLFGKKPAEILKAKTIEEQKELFDLHIAPFFDNWLVKALGRSPIMVYSLGIPPQQWDAMKADLNQVNMLEEFRNRVRRLTCDYPIQENYFAWQALSRRYDLKNRKALPSYLKEENFNLLRANVDRVETNITTLSAFLQTQDDNSLNRFVLLDSQDWMKPEAMIELWSEIARTGQPGTRVIFRTAGEVSPLESIFTQDLKDTFVYEPELSRALHAKDRSAIYGGFHLYRIPR